MRISLLAFAALIFSSSIAHADNAPLKNQDPLSYDSLVSYTDGTVRIEGPRFYGFYIGASGPQGLTNAKFICGRLNLNTFLQEGLEILGVMQTINFAENSDGSFSDALLLQDNAYIQRIFCRP